MKKKITRFLSWIAVLGFLTVVAHAAAKAPPMHERGPASVMDFPR